ncbi:MAG TPA: phage holin family protein [Pirellulaceae bacterium]|jgi:ABC-type phosphate/phosphonate transport system permease subunit
MVDQAQINAADEMEPTARELPPRAVARSTAELLHDMATLAELQGKLVLIDCREGTAKLLLEMMMIAMGAAIGLGCVPIGLAMLALIIAANTTLSLPVSFAIALATGLVLACILAIPACIAVQRNIHVFDRSLAEWRRNRQWFKETLRRLGKSPPQRGGPLPMPTGRF